MLAENAGEKRHRIQVSQMAADAIREGNIMREHFHLLNGFSFPTDKERIKTYVNGILPFLLIIIVALVLG